MRKRNGRVKTSKKYFTSVPLELNLTVKFCVILYICSDRETRLFAGKAYIHQRQQEFSYKRFEEYCSLNYYLGENNFIKDLKFI